MSDAVCVLLCALSLVLGVVLGLVIGMMRGGPKPALQRPPDPAEIVRKQLDNLWAYDGTERGQTEIENKD